MVHSCSRLIGHINLGRNVVGEVAVEPDEIPAKLRAHPDVLGVRWEIYAQAGQWEACLDIGIALTELAPKRPNFWCNRATALHRLGRTAEARDVLLQAVDIVGEDWAVFYELARFSCLIGRVDEAKIWLAQAFDACGDAAAAGRLKMMELEDGDLEGVAC
jgi:tetratricopeptide (TPR) repeat protein